MRGSRTPWVLAAVAVLAVLHQDLWFWDDPTLVAGVLPVGLAWHAGFSAVSALLFVAVGRWAWPEDPAGDEGGGR